MKYVTILFMILLTGVGVNITKDKLAVNDASEKSTVVQNVEIGDAVAGWSCTGEAPNCSCLSMGDACKCTVSSTGVRTCSSGDVNSSIPATSTKKYYKLNLQYVVAGNYGPVKLGKVTPSNPGKYEAGAIAILTSTPAKGFTTLWDGECLVKGQEVCKIRMNSDKTVKVSYKQKPGWKCRINLAGYLTCTKEW